MAKENVLVAESRDETGTHAARRLRRDGWCPGVVNGRESGSQKIRLNTHDFEVLLHHHAGENLLAAKLRIFKQQGVGVHYHARSAESALDGAIFKKGFLQRMKLISLCQAFYGRDFLPLNRSDRRYAGAYSLVVDDDGARTAKAAAAAVFCSRKPEIGSEDPQQFSVALNINAGRFSVKYKTNGFFHIGTLNCLV